MRNYDEEIKHTVFTSGYYRRRNSGSDRSDAVRMDYNRTKDKTVRKRDCGILPYTKGSVHEFGNRLSKMIPEDPKMTPVLK